nr:hypothetical protein [Tanacetum cinerariifolium]
MNTPQAQQKALDDALVTPKDRLEFRKCNMRLKTAIKPKVATFQFVLDALALPSFYQAFLIIAEICLKVPGQQFEEPLLEHDILSFLRDLRHFGDIHCITGMSIDYLHQPWGAIATIINKCLSGKDTAYEKIPEQIKLATKRSKKDLYMSHASGSGDGVDTQSKVPNEQQQKVFGTNERASVRPEVSDVPKYDSKSDEESWTFSQDGDDADKEIDRVSTPPEYEHIEEEEEENKEGDDEDIEGEHEQDEEDDMYIDVNINLERSNAEMTNAQANPDTEDTYVTLTTVPPVVQQQSSSVSSDFVSKFLNPSQDTCIDSILNLNIQSEILLQTEKLREEAQAENQEFLNQVQAQVSKIMPKIKKYIRESLEAKVLVRSTNQPQTSYAVAASLSEFELKKILIDKMEENKSINRSDIMKNLYNALVESYNSDKDIITSYGAVVTLKRDMMKNLYNALVESYNSDKDIITSYGAVVTLKRGRDDPDKDEDPSARLNQWSKRRKSGKEAESSKEPTHKESKSTSSSKGASRSQPKSLGKSVVKIV